MAMLCPHCRGEYLHHGKVEIFDREKEDSPTGLRVSVVDNTLTVTTDMLTNPSCRRDGIRISFWCELCHHDSELTIAQHKGQSLLEFNDLGINNHGSGSDRLNELVDEAFKV